MAAVGVALAREPQLWPTAFTQWRRTIPSRWWRRRPFLPVPTGDYLRFRMVTQYGNADHPIVPADVVSYIKWCRLQAHGR